MLGTCLCCGATMKGGESCRDRFDWCMIKEIEQPAYGVVHYLSVPSFMLQHNEYSREGWLAARELLSKFVFQGLMPADARRRYRKEVDSEKRKWHLTKGPKLEGFETIAWSRTISELRLDSAESYCNGVRAWARSILKDTEGLIRALDSSHCDGRLNRQGRNAL